VKPFTRRKTQFPRGAVCPTLKQRYKKGYSALFSWQKYIVREVFSIGDNASVSLTLSYQRKVRFSDAFLSEKGFYRYKKFKKSVKTAIRVFPFL